jgi:acyl dehydratase
VSEAAASVEELLKSVIGKPTGRSTVVVERGPVAFFASTVGEKSPVYRDPQAAAAAGLAGIPAPPTFPIAMESWGKFAELQPEGGTVLSPLATVIGPLMSGGGLILHGEQEFVYHRPVMVGDVLEGDGKVVDAYQKESKGKTMTFLVTETEWTDKETGEPVVTTRFNVIHRA